MNICIISEEGLESSTRGYFSWTATGDSRACQSFGGNTIGQKLGAGVANWKATSSPRAPGAGCVLTTVHSRATPVLEFVSKNCCPAEISICRPSSPPWALTTRVDVVSSVTSPSLELSERRTGTFSITLSLRRLFAPSVDSVEISWFISGHSQLSSDVYDRELCSKPPLYIRLI